MYNFKLDYRSTAALQLPFSICLDATADCEGLQTSSRKLLTLQDICWGSNKNPRQETLKYTPLVLLLKIKPFSIFITSDYDIATPFKYKKTSLPQLSTSE